MIEQTNKLDLHLLFIDFEEALIMSTRRVSGSHLGEEEYPKNHHHDQGLLFLSIPAGGISIAIRDEQIENQKSFTYLGGELVKGGGTIVDIDKRICKARGAFDMMCPIWRNSTIRRNTNPMCSLFCFMSQVHGKWLTRTNPSCKFS